MSNARNLANLLGTGTTVPSAKMPTGSVLQTLSATITDVRTMQTTSWADITGLSLNITPSATANKILITGFVTIGVAIDITPMVAIYAGSGHVGSGTGGNRTKGHTGLGYWYIQSSGAQDQQYGFFQCPINYLWSANTTSQQTVKLQAINGDSTNVEFYINRSRRSDNSDWLGSSTSNLTVQEIKG
tara:strand:+ start:196 stop:753 length:558 start_codon:yes stop_codon:yes gene_type:complete